MTVIIISAVTCPDLGQIFNMPVHRSTMPQINMIPQPVVTNHQYFSPFQ